MMKICSIRNLILVVLVLTFSNAIGQGAFHKTLLFSDRNLEVSLLCRDTASFDQENWLQLEIRNVTDQPVYILDLDYSLNHKYAMANGKIMLDHGRFGAGNKFDVFQVYHDIDNASDLFRDGILIDAGEALLNWKHLSNSAAVGIEPFAADVKPSRQLSVSITMSVSYKVSNKVRDVEIARENICFYWRSYSEIPEHSLLRRFQQAIHGSSLTSNQYVISRLMHDTILKQQITTSDFIDAIGKDKRGRREYVNIMFLKELSERNALPDTQLTSHYTQQLRNGYFPTGELFYSWHNLMLDDVLKANTYYGNVANLLERTSATWSTHEEARKKVFLFLQAKTHFDTTTKPDQANFKEWSTALKFMSISRDMSLVHYLMGLLENEIVFQLDDWSRYEFAGFLGPNDKPDTLFVRVCDIAFVSLMRVLGQTYIFEGRALNFKQDLIPVSERIMPSHGSRYFNVQLQYAEKYYKLTPTTKEALKEYVAAMKN